MTSKHRLLCNAHCISMATVVTRIHFIITLYVHWLSCIVTGLSTAEQVASLVTVEQWYCLLNG